MLPITALLVALSLAAPPGPGKRTRSAVTMHRTGTTLVPRTFRAHHGLLPRKPPRRQAHRRYRVWRFPAPWPEPPLPLPPLFPDAAALAAGSPAPAPETSPSGSERSSASVGILVFPAVHVCRTCPRESQADARTDAVEAVLYAAAPFEAIAVALGRGLLQLEHDLAGRLSASEDVADLAGRHAEDSAAERSPAAEPDVFGGD